MQKVDNADANVYTEYFYDNHDRLYLARCVKDGDVAITYSFEYDDDYDIKVYHRYICLSRAIILF